MFMLFGKLKCIGLCCDVCVWFKCGVGCCGVLIVVWVCGGFICFWEECCCGCFFMRLFLFGFVVIC